MCVSPPNRRNHAVRIAAGDANVILGGDLVVAASNDCLAKIRQGFTRAVINAYQSPTGEVLHNPDMRFPAASMEQTLIDAVGDAAHPFRQRHQHRHRAARRQHCQQYVHARPCLAVPG